jgi:hypothetical protein
VILKSKRIKARGPALKRSLNHVINGDDNDEVELVCGNIADLNDARDDALRIGREYAVREFIACPEQEISVGQRDELIGWLAEEFKFQKDHAVVWRHRRARAAEGVTDQHFHIFVREVDAVTGRVMSCSNNFARHEKISRIAEVRWKHACNPGAHNYSVLSALDEDTGLSEVAEALRRAEGIGVPGTPQSFDTSNHQRLKRAGLDVPRLQVLISEALSSAVSRADFENRLAGIRLKLQSGTKRDTLIVETLDGQLVGSLPRLTRLRKEALNERMKFNVADRPGFQAADDSSGKLSHVVQIDEAVGIGGEARADSADGHPGSTGTDGNYNRAPAESHDGHRPDPGPHGSGRSSTGRSGADEGIDGSRPRIALDLRLAGQQNELLDLLAISRRSAQTPLDRAISDLDQLIEDNTPKMSPPLQLKEPDSLVQAREDLRGGRSRLRALEAEEASTVQRLSELPRNSIWNRFWRPAKIAERQRLSERLMKQSKLFQKVTAKCFQLEQKIVSDEREFKLARDQRDLESAQRSDQAEHKLATAEEAKKFIVRNPRFAAWGFPRLMQVAAWISKARLGLEEADTDECNLVLRKGISGEPDPPPPKAH